MVGVNFLSSPVWVCAHVFVCLYVCVWSTDQHLHDTPVELWQRPAGPVHLQEPGEVPGNVDQPKTPDAAACAPGPPLLPDLPRGEGPHLAGNCNYSLIIIDFQSLYGTTSVMNGKIGS